MFGQADAETASLSTADTSVDVAFDDGRATGTVAVGDGEARPFSAEHATGRAGIYRAAYSLGDEDFSIDWIVLADGRRRGPLDGKGNDVIVVAD